MAPHVHKMTRLDVGPPKRFFCETPGCDYTEPVIAPGILADAADPLSAQPPAKPLPVPTPPAPPTPAPTPVPNPPRPSGPRGQQSKEF